MDSIKSKCWIGSGRFENIGLQESMVPTEMNVCQIGLWALMIETWIFKAAGHKPPHPYVQQIGLICVMKKKCSWTIYATFGHGKSLKSLGI